MEWFHGLGYIFIDNMIAFGWNRLKEKLAHALVKFVRQKLGNNVKATLQDIEVS